jgi:hypothetical protein
MQALLLGLSGHRVSVENYPTQAFGLNREPSRFCMRLCALVGYLQALFGQYNQCPE